MVTVCGLFLLYLSLHFTSKNHLVIGSILSGIGIGLLRIV